jgi:predicted permease
MYEVEGQPAVADWRKGPQALFRLSGPNYFATLGIPLMRGRDFTGADSYDAPFVAIVSQSLVRRSFPNEDPIGKQIRCGLDSPKWMTIVGVVKDVRSLSPDKSPEAELYMPLAQHPFMANELQVAMRVAPGVKPESLSEAVRAKVREENPVIAVRFTTLDAMLSGSIGGQRFRAFLLTAFAGVALMLAMAGVYGVMSYVTTQRMSEMGLRMALGAGPSSLLMLILGRVLWLGVGGLVIGLAGAMAASRALAGMLFGLQPLDFGTYALVSAVVLAVTALSALGPAWKATRVDPVIALRQE